MRVLVISPESCGSKLVAKIVAHVLGIKKYGDWFGGGKVFTEKDEVYHVSLPRTKKREFVDIKPLVSWSTHIVVTTRDHNISADSKCQYCETIEQAIQENEIAKSMLEPILQYRKTFVFSYETFIYYRLTYLKLLYRFLGVESSFIPSLHNGNRKYLR